MTKKEINLPVIPQFVADYVELFKSKYAFPVLELATLESHDIPQNVKEWLFPEANIVSDIVKNTQKFMLAVMYGYEIKKTKKYLIKSPLIDDEGDFQYVNRTSDNNTYQWEYFKYAFTMEEIENDPQLSQLKQFAVEVEDEI